MADETLNKLLKAHGINDDTAVLLADQGFVTEEAISVLTIGDIPSLKIKKLVQRRLLEKMINKLEEDSAVDIKEKESRRDAVTLDSRRMDTSVLGSSMGATGSEHVANSQDAPDISRIKDNDTTTSSSLSTVLLYDREYRSAQANYNFPWGSDVPHLVSVHLVPRNDRIPGGGKSEKKDSFQSKQASGSARYQKPYPCNLFYTEGTGKCGSNCRFTHECNKCKGPHPGCEHPK